MPDETPRPRHSTHSWRHDDDEDVAGHGGADPTDGHDATGEDLDEDPSPEDIARFGDDRDDDDDRRRGGSAEVRCQECRAPMFANADVCPKCGAFQMRLGTGRTTGGSVPPMQVRLTRLIVVLVIVGLVLAIVPALLRGLF